jgi:hypothetical protein
MLMLYDDIVDDLYDDIIKVDDKLFSFNINFIWWIFDVCIVWISYRTLVAEYLFCVEFIFS